MYSWRDHYNRPTRPQEQQLYNHWLGLSQIESPDYLIERFRLLFIEGSDYPDESVRSIVDAILNSELDEQEFTYVLNRCCYILINRWLIHPRLQGAIPDLIAVFEQFPTSPAYPRSVVRLRELVRLFIRSDQYQTLQRLAEMLRQDSDLLSQSRPLGSYIRRYPYLYEHCLLGEDSSNDQRHTVRQIQTQAQRKFEIDLSQYITHQLVRPQSSEASVLASPESLGTIDCQLLTAAETAGPLPLIKNPTLLSDRELHRALKQFICKVDGQNTQRDLAQHFLTYSRQTPSFRAFKHDLFEYLAAAIVPEYGNRQFYDRLYTHLCETLTHNDDQLPNDFLLMRTCSKLLNFLVVESPQQPSHFVFLDLINNVGTTLAVSLLMRVVLLCHKVKSQLEKRFSILFKHYEACTQENGIGWLIEALETLNVAFATNFGSVNFSSFA